MQLVRSDLQSIHPIYFRQKSIDNNRDKSNNKKHTIKFHIFICPEFIQFILKAFTLFTSITESWGLFHIWIIPLEKKNICDNVNDADEDCKAEVKLHKYREATYGTVGLSQSDDSLPPIMLQVQR